MPDYGTVLLRIPRLFDWGIVIGSGNPRVVTDLSGPPPEETPTLRKGYGFWPGKGTGSDG